MSTIAPPRHAMKSWLDTDICHRELLRALPVAIYTCDEYGIVTFYNEAAVSLWGHRPELGKDTWYGAWQIFRRDGTPLLPYEGPTPLTIQDGHSPPGEEIIVQRPDGSRRFLLAHPEPIRNADGRVVGAVNTLMDLSNTEHGQRVLLAFPNHRG